MKIVRVTLIVLLVIALLVMGYFRERYLLVVDPDTIFSFIKKYPRTAITNYRTELDKVIGFNLSPKLTSSILFSLFSQAFCSAKEGKKTAISFCNFANSIYSFKSFIKYIEAKITFSFHLL